MQLLRRSVTPPEKPAGLPLWMLMATAPVVVSLGLLAGVASAIYWAPPEPVTPSSPLEAAEPHLSPTPLPNASPIPIPTPMPSRAVSSPPVSTPPLSPTPISSTPISSTPTSSTPTASTPTASTPTASTPTSSTPTASTPVSAEPPNGQPVTVRQSDDSFAAPLNPLSSLYPVRRPGNVTLPSSPAQQTLPIGVVRNVREARTELVRSFSTFQAGSVTVSTIDYQQMLNRSQSTSIVGMLSLESYAEWNRALEQEPKQLQSWLKLAAETMLPATSSDRIFLSWAVVDVRSTRPTGFASHEVTEMSNGTFLVIRLLASTLSHVDPVVILRSHENLAMSSRLGPNEGGPWTTYTPVLNFDSTDKYRPPTTAGTRPR